MKGQVTIEIHEICRAHGRTAEEARVQICAGRKVGYIVSSGEITSDQCFHMTKPTPSVKVARGQASPYCGTITLIPHGFKVGFCSLP